MKWPFARHAQSPESPTGDAGSATTAEPTRPAVATPARRDWATLPPLKVAGGRPIELTAATQAFAQGLATRQVLVRSARLEHVRQMDAPSGSFRGVLAPAVGFVLIQHYSVGLLAVFSAVLIVAATLLLLPEIKFGRRARPGGAVIEEVSE